MSQERSRFMAVAAGCMLVAVLMWAGGGDFGAGTASAAEAAKKALALERATMCEGIEAYMPKDPAVVFSVSVGRVSCFTAFDPVPRKTMIQHRWYFRDQLITTKRLHLRTPKWATYSSIQPRLADIGPWRVEVIDPEGNIMDTLRFSIVQ